MQRRKRDMRFAGIDAITITSATKSFNIPALRCAVMHFGGSALKEGFEKRIPPRLLGSRG
jgi:cysteine-S-conjugate beta-lyase